MTASKLRYLVVGSTSVIGAAIVAELSKAANVVTMGRRDADVIMDLSDPLTAGTISHALDVAVLVAGDFGGSAPQDYVRAEVVNAAGMVAACVAAESAGVDHIVLISSSSAEYSPGDPYFGIYSLSKRHGEEAVALYCSDRNIALTILRPTAVYDRDGKCRRHQPLLYHFVDCARDGRDITINGSADPLRNFIYLDDLVRAVRLVVERRVVGRFGCPGARSTTITEVARTAFSVFGRGGVVRFDGTKADVPSLASSPGTELYDELSNWPEVDLGDGLSRIAQVLDESVRE
jgi:nucleoside-diphosphate-sugar epimerase